MNEQEKKFLADDAAIRVSYWSNPQTGDAILVRKWNVSRGDLHSSSLTYLNTIKTVKDPRAIADGKSKSYPGNWRVVPNQVPENQHEIVQTLILFVSDSGMKWASGDSTLDDWYSYAYRNMAAPVQTKIAEQGLTSETKNTLNDKFLYDAESRLDHSHPYLWATHVGENALATGDNLGYKNYRTRPEAPASTVQGTIYDAKSTFNRDGSYDGDVRYETSKAKELAGKVVETALDVDYEVAYVNGRTRPAVPATTTQGLVYDAKSTVNKDETYQGAVGYKASKTRTWADTSQTALGTAYGYSYMNSRTRPTTPASSAQGFVYDAKSTINKDDTYEGGAGYEYSKPDSWTDVTENALTIDVAHAYLNYRARPTAATGAAQGYIYDAKATENKDGTYSGGAGYAYSKPIQLTDVQRSTLATALNHSYQNSRTKPTAPTGTIQGFIYDAKSTLKADGGYDGNAGYDYSVPVAWAQKTETMTGTGYDCSYKNSRTIPSAPSSAVQGFIYDAKLTVNKDGSYDGSAGYEYNKPLMWADGTNTALDTTYGYSYRASRTRPTAPTSAVQGFIYDAKVTVNKDGSYDGGSGYAYSKPDQWADVVENTLSQDTNVSYVNSRMRPTAPASAVQGVFYEVKSTDNKDGTYGGGIGYSYSKPVQMASQTLAGAYEAAYEVAYINSRTRPAVPASTVIGTVYDAKSTMNRDGGYSGGVGYEYAAPVELYLTWYSNEGTKGLRKYTNWQSVPATIAALTADTENSVDLAYSSRTGTIDATVRITTDTSGGSMSGVSVDTNEHTSNERQVIGYNSSTEKWMVQQWIRHEKFFKDRAQAATYLSDSQTAGNADAERATITYTHVLGGYWIAVFYVRQAAAFEADSSNSNTPA